MKYEAAKEIGADCGLDDPAEFVWNVWLHKMNLFAYAEMNGEVQELYDDAKANGVPFSSVCDHPILAADSPEDPCYMCRKFEAVQS